MGAVRLDPPLRPSAADARHSDRGHTGPERGASLATSQARWPPPGSPGRIDLDPAISYQGLRRSGGTTGPVVNVLQTRIVRNDERKFTEKTSLFDNYLSSLKDQLGKGSLWEDRMLDALGLSAMHEAVYRAMLGNPDLNVAGLADQLGLSLDQVRVALDVLADLALVRIDSAGKQVRAIRPQLGLTALLARVEAEVATRQRQIDATRAAIDVIANMHDAYTEGGDGR